MKVTIKYFTLLRTIVGEGEEDYEFQESARVKDVWAKILGKHGTEMKKAGYVDAATEEPKSILIALSRIGVLGFKHVDFYDGLKTELNDGDMIAIYPPIMGG
jgi:molybdopterin converting factor small subunit